MYLNLWHFFSFFYPRVIFLSSIYFFFMKLPSLINHPGKFIKIYLVKRIDIRFPHVYSIIKKRKIPDWFCFSFCLYKKINSNFSSVFCVPEKNIRVTFFFYVFWLPLLYFIASSSSLMCMKGGDFPVEFLLYICTYVCVYVF